MMATSATAVITPFHSAAYVRERLGDEPIRTPLVVAAVVWSMNSGFLGFPGYPRLGERLDAISMSGTALASC